ncbi:zeta toxin family protein [uncultured Dubosiella sp.]|nr:zeta toxin family protein [uncultured Dubosiella sp.]
MNNSKKKPEIVVFAGPNGSGKSTITELLKPPIDYINADEIKKNLKCSDLEAAQLAEKQRQQHVQSMSEFAFETVLSTPRNLNLLKDAKKKGYFIRCYYVLTADPGINVWRIKSRVESGGHDVPEEKIISRYDRALKLLKDLIPVCDICHIYDNSGDAPFRIFKKRKTIFFFDSCEDWHLEDI